MKYAEARGCTVSSPVCPFLNPVLAGAILYRVFLLSNQLDCVIRSDGYYFLELIYQKHS